MIKYFRRTKWIWIALGTATVGVIGYALGGGFAEPAYCCQHPLAESKTWQRAATVVSALGVITAICIAVFRDIRIDKRFNRQVRIQMRLDKKADDRQQAEWDKATDKNDRQKQTFEKGTVKLAMLLTMEFDIHYDVYQNQISAIDNETWEAMSREDFRKMFPVERSYPILFKLIGSQIVELNPRLFATCLAFEKDIKTFLDLFADALKKHPITKKDLLEKIDDIRRVAIPFLASLSKIDMNLDEQSTKAVMARKEEIYAFVEAFINDGAS